MPIPSALLTEPLDLVTIGHTDGRGEEPVAHAPSEPKLAWNPLRAADVFLKWDF